MSALFNNVHYGLRQLKRSPGFSVVAILALAIGIGANVTIFSFANALLLKPLPVAQPEQVVRVYAGRESNVRYADYLEYRDRNHTLTELAAFQINVSLNLRAEGSAEYAVGSPVTGNYFRALGISAALGRVLDPGDDSPGAPGVAVLSDVFWRRRFGADPRIAGRNVVISGRPYTVVGVAPRSFTGTAAPFAAELWISLGGMNLRSVSLIGRLKPVTSIRQAYADLSTINTDLEQRMPEGYRQGLSVYPARTLFPGFVGPVTAFAGLLMTVAGLVLLIACINIASLLLSRSVSRRQEIGVRLALGATRRHVVFQLLVESFLLAAIGGLAAMTIGFVTVRTFNAFSLPVPLPVILDTTLDWRIVGFTAGLSLITTILFGLLPALQSTKPDVISAIKGSDAGNRIGRSKVRAILVIAQVSMSTLLLVTAGLLVRSLTSEEAANRGFIAEGVIAASIDLQSTQYTPEQVRAFQDNLLQHLAQVPSLVSASLAAIAPLSLSDSSSPMLKEGQPTPTSPAAAHQIHLNSISHGYFSTLGIPLVKGRDFQPRDSFGTRDVAIVNETLAQRLWPGENPVGKRLRAWSMQGPEAPWIEVIGVVRNSKYQFIGEDPRPFMYRPLSQRYSAACTLLIKTASATPAALSMLRREVEALDPNVAVFGAQTMEQATSVSLLPVKVAAATAASLGLLALALGTIGIYGVISFLVRQRTREIAIRVSLGAQPSVVAGMMIRQAMTWTATGLVIGLGLSLVVTRLLTGLLYGVSSTDPLTFLGISTILAASAYAACYLPARRVSRIDPLVALREE